MSRPLAAFAALLMTSTPTLAQDAVLERGREFSRHFLAGDIAPIWDAMGSAMRDALGGAADLETFQAGVVSEFGEEAAVLDEQALSQEGLDVYVRTGQWTGIDAPVDILWAFDPDGTIEGFYVRPQAEAADSAYLDYETQSDLRLPFDGEWYVFWGGRDIADNYHAANPAQRFAYDFVVHEDGRSHAGDPDLLESYHCWGREILAPAAGRVIATVHDLPDQPIGSMDPANPAGNHVILALAENEYAFLAHLQQGSVRVQQGDEVEAGAVLGLCGNSGNTSEPHLHFHLQTTTDLFEGDGLPAQFQDYEADGETVERGEPVRGQLVAPAP